MKMVNWRIDRHWLLVTCCWLSSCFLTFAAAQDSSLILKNTLSIENTDFTTDRLQNIYALNNENILIKYNAQGKRLFDYNNQNYGKPSYIDASNPLRLLVYYKEFLTAVVLDRTLTELYVFNLQDYEINQCEAISNANDNGLWTFDSWTFQLKKINELGTTERTSDDLNQLLGIEIEPTQLSLSDNRLYLNAPNHGIFVFTLFGQYVETIPLKNIDHFQVQNNHIIFYKNGQLQHYSLQFQTLKDIHIPKIKNVQAVQNIQNVQISGNYIFISTKNDISIFQVKE